MKYIHILVEGQTEESFVNDVLTSHLKRLEIHPIARILHTGKLASGAAAKGGAVSYARVQSELQQLFRDSSVVIFTTMFDYHRMKSDFPGYSELKPDWSGSQKVEHLEQAFKHDIGEPRFLPYLSLHEFEALLFSKPETIAHWFADKNLEKLQQIRNDYHTPEEINEEKPPSKHLKELFPKYDKVNDGNIIAVEIGLAIIRKECPHFDKWLTQLEKLSEST